MAAATAIGQHVAEKPALAPAEVAYEDCETSGQPPGSQKPIPSRYGYRDTNVITRIASGTGYARRAETKADKYYHVGPGSPPGLGALTAPPAPVCHRQGLICPETLRGYPKPRLLP